MNVGAPTDDDRPLDPSPFAPRRLAAMRETYAPPAFDRETLASERYLLASEGRFRVYYAPIATWPSATARIVFVGLTPGFTQMTLAARAYLETPAIDRDDRAAFTHVVRARVAYAGSMRKNLCHMLDELGFPAAWGVRASDDLFAIDRTDVITTSALVFPVFEEPGRKNFSGRGLDLARVPLFRTMLDELLAPRLRGAPNATIVPFGTVVASGIRYLCAKRTIDCDRILWGLPHPSGSNGHRVRQFRENFEEMRLAVDGFFSGTIGADDARRR